VGNTLYTTKLLEITGEKGEMSSSLKFSERAQYKLMVEGRGYLLCIGRCSNFPQISRAVFWMSSCDDDTPPFLEDNFNTINSS
jgi:hypothetical protein